MSMDDHDADGSRWRSIAEGAIEEMICPLCGGTGREESSPFTSDACSRCQGTGLVTEAVRSEHDARAAAAAREVANHLNTGVSMFRDASDLFLRHATTHGMSLLDAARMKNDLAQTHLLLAIADLLKGA